MEESLETDAIKKCLPVYGGLIKLAAFKMQWSDRSYHVAKACSCKAVADVSPSEEVLTAVYVGSRVMSMATHHLK